jgi:hypothetical protein
MKIKHCLFVVLLVFASLVSASDWVVNSHTGGIFENEETHKLIIKFDGNSIVLSNPTRIVGPEETATSNPLNNLAVTEVGGVVAKSQQLGLLTQLENLLLSEQDSAKALRSMADLFGKRDEVIQELDAIRTAVKSVN